MALSFPNTSEQPHFEKTSFRTKKIFATLDIERMLVCLLLSEIEQSVFCAYNKTIFYPVPNKWGKQGATYVELKTVPKRILKDALTHAYERSLVKQHKK